MIKDEISFFSQDDLYNVYTQDVVTIIYALGGCTGLKTDEFKKNN